MNKQSEKKYDLNKVANTDILFREKSGMRYYFIPKSLYSDRISGEIDKLNWDRTPNDNELCSYIKYEANGKSIKHYVPKDEFHIIVCGGGRGSIYVYGEGMALANRIGAGDGHVIVATECCGHAIREGEGHGDAVRLMPDKVKYGVSGDSVCNNAGKGKAINLIYNEATIQTNEEVCIAGFVENKRRPTDKFHSYETADMTDYNLKMEPQYFDKEKNITIDVGQLRRHLLQGNNAIKICLPNKYYLTKYKIRAFYYNLKYKHWIFLHDWLKRTIITLITMIFIGAVTGALKKIWKYVSNYI